MRGGVDHQANLFIHLTHSSRKGQFESILEEPENPGNPN